MQIRHIIEHTHLKNSSAVCLELKLTQKLFTHPHVNPNLYKLLYYLEKCLLKNSY